MTKKQATTEDSANLRVRPKKIFSWLTVRGLVAGILGISTSLSILVFALFSFSFVKIIDQNIEKNINDLVADGRGIFSRTIERYAIATEAVARDADVQSFVDNPESGVDVVMPITRQKVLYHFDVSILLSGSGELLYGDTQDNALFDNPDLQQMIVRGRNLKTQQALIVQSSFYQKPILLVILPVAGLERHGAMIYGKVMDEEFLKGLFPSERRGVFIPVGKDKIGAANIFDVRIRKEIENEISDMLEQRVSQETQVTKRIDSDYFKGILAVASLTQASFSVGEVGFFIDEKELFAVERNAIWVNALVLLGLGLMFLLALMLMTKFVVKPIAQLSEGFSKVEKEDFSVRLIPSGLADFKNILDGFNKAMQQVSIRTSQLNESTQALQDKNAEAKKNYSAMMNVLEDARMLENNLEKANFSIGKQKERAESILGFLRSIGDSVIATDLSGKIIFFNEAAEKITGVPATEALGKNSTEVLFIFSEKGDQSRRLVVRETLEGGENIHKKNERFVLKKADGSLLPVSFSPSLIFDEKKKRQGAILVIRDVAEERELERTKDSFLSVAAHQLRTPLSGIRWNLEMLLEGDVGELPKEAKEVVKNINENNLRLVTLVNDLLNVSRINLGKMTEPPKEVCVAEAIASVLKSGKGFVSKNKVALIFDPEKNKNLKVLISPERFFESIENVVSNAIKYTAEKGEVKIAVAKKEDKVEISIADNGIGIPEKEQAKMFSKFFRAENAVRKDPEGSGLGLSVVKSFIEEAGGEVTFRSEEGRGTTFFLTLPICPCTKEDSGEKKK